MDRTQRNGAARRGGPVPRADAIQEVRGIIIPASEEAMFTAARTKMIASEHLVRKKGNVKESPFR